MRLLTDKYGRTWLVEYRTYTLLTEKQLSMLKKVVAIFLFSICSFGQSSIIASGSENITIGETFPIMQTIQKESVSLGVPVFEIPIERPKLLKKKPLTFWEKILKLLGL